MSKVKDVVKEIQKKYKLEEGVLASASQIIDNPKQVIPVSPNMDLALNGGIPEGSWVSISGLPGLGKTTLALDFAATCQRPEFGDRIIVYVDIEARLKEMYLKGITGLDISEEKFILLQSRKGNILSAEDNINIACDLLTSMPNIVLILDSTSALCSSKELTEEITGQTRAMGPKILASFCRKMAPIVPIQKSIIILIQHLIANTSGYGSPFLEDSGNKIKYQSDVKIMGKGFSDWKEGESLVGQTIKWDVIKSALGQPGARPEMKLRYGYGIDKISEMVEIACELKIIQGTTWLTLPYDDNQKFQGKGKLWTYLKENPAGLDKLKEQLKGVV